MAYVFKITRCESKPCLGLQIMTSLNLDLNNIFLTRSTNINWSDTRNWDDEKMATKLMIDMKIFGLIKNTVKHLSQIFAGNSHVESVIIFLISGFN